MEDLANLIQQKEDEIIALEKEMKAKIQEKRKKLLTLYEDVREIEIQPGITVAVELIGGQGFSEGGGIFVQVKNAKDARYWSEFTISKETSQRLFDLTTAQIEKQKRENVEAKNEAKLRIY